ncbi:allatostatin-A receptor-like [Anneissia japonica]|uniref:allatostatin-A receptor-like n=1 Tax=Anneissia japonica TaxID=1529436 RepID=UPI0014254C5E|nr:allatostatin-A receptor-like [Anneissia japonica]
MTTVGYTTLSTNDSMDLDCDTEGWLCYDCDGKTYVIMNTTTEIEGMPLYCRYMKFKKVSRIIYLMVALFIFLLAVIGNALVLIIVKRFRDMKNVTNYLLANLAVTDLTCTFLASLPSVIIYFHDIIPEQWTLVIINYVQMVTAQASCVTFIVLAVHRYFVSKNMFAKGNQVPYRIQLSSVPKILASIWILSVVLHVPVLILKIRQGTDDEKWRYYIIYYFIMVYVNPLVIIPVLYYNIVDLIWRATSVRSNSSNSSAVLSGIRLQTHRKKKRASRVIFAVVCIFIVCWTPYCIFNFYIAFFPYRSPMSMWAFMDSARLVSHTLIYFSNCINPIIYAFSGLPYRRHFKELFALCVIYCAKPETQMDTTNDFIYS